MTRWQTNLIKDYVPSLAQRRAYCVAMLSFFGLCGLALFFIVLQASQRTLDAIHERAKIRQIESKFRVLHSGLTGNLADIVSRLEKELEGAHHQLKTVDKLVRQRISLSRLLAGIQQPLPRDVQLVRLDVRPSQDTVQFDLVMPNVPEEEETRAGALVDAYNTLPLLTTQLREVQIVARQTQRARDQSVVVLRLEGRLNRKPEAGK